MFSSETYVKRRQELLNKVNSGIILLPGNEESPMNYTDNPYHFRQDSTFLYYFGLSRPGLVALLDTSNGNVSVYGDDFVVEDFVWMGEQPTINELAALCGVENTGSITDLYHRISQANKQSETIHWLPQYRSKNILKLMDMTGLGVQEIKTTASTELIMAVVSQRSYKAMKKL